MRDSLARPIFVSRNNVRLNYIIGHALAGLITFYSPNEFPNLALKLAGACSCRFVGSSSGGPAGAAMVGRTLRPKATFGHATGGHSARWQRIGRAVGRWEREFRPAGKAAAVLSVRGLQRGGGH